MDLDLSFLYKPNEDVLKEIEQIKKDNEIVNKFKNLTIDHQLEMLALKDQLLLAKNELIKAKDELLKSKDELLKEKDQIELENKQKDLIQRFESLKNTNENIDIERRLLNLKSDSKEFDDIKNDCDKDLEERLLKLKKPIFNPNTTEKRVRFDLSKNTNSSLSQSSSLFQDSSLPHKSTLPEDRMNSLFNPPVVEKRQDISCFGADNYIKLSKEYIKLETQEDKDRFCNLFATVFNATQSKS